MTYLRTVSSGSSFRNGSNFTPNFWGRVEVGEAAQSMRCATRMAMTVATVEAVEQAADKHCCKRYHAEIATTCLLMAAAW